MGIYSVKGLCSALEEKWLTEAGWVVSRQLRKMVPAKVSTFMWQLQLDRIATKAGLLSRGFSLPDEGVCSLCVADLETSSHLFLHCKELKVKSDGILWDMTPFALCWSVWVERNDMGFNDRIFNAEAVWDMHLARITGWVRAWWNHCPYSANQIVLGIQHISLPKKKKVRTVQQWVPPATPILKFNVDGSTLGGPGRSGVVGC
ncbi:uncharacterized protein LOC130712574 [Lotus japonicus]|uniref:uncharacterized protein LOC130712574 n=1 Tax=Lotus japonicus TaxID=34305 RepID=UPI0025883165|nr:uncharacterized protein LOC130712574 [Lotus japonicus]